MKKFKDLELEEQLKLCRAALCGETIEGWTPGVGQPGRWVAERPVSGLSLCGECIYRVKREPEQVYTVSGPGGKILLALSREDAEEICRARGLDESAIKTFREVIE